MEDCYVICVLCPYPRSHPMSRTFSGYRSLTKGNQTLCNSTWNILAPWCNQRWFWIMGEIVLLWMYCVNECFNFFFFLPDLKTAFSILAYLIKPGTIYGIKTFYNYKTGHAILSYLLRNIVNGVPIKCL